MSGEPQIKKMLPIRGDAYNCLRCRATLDAMSYTGGDAPADVIDQRTTLEWLEGSVSVCAYCQHIAVFVIDRGAVALRPVRRDEWPGVWSALAASLPDLVDDLRAANVSP